MMRLSRFCKSTYSMKEVRCFCRAITCSMVRGCLLSRIWPYEEKAPAVSGWSLTLRSVEQVVRRCTRTARIQDQVDFLPGRLSLRSPLHIVHTARVPQGVPFQTDRQQAARTHLPLPG